MSFPCVPLTGFPSQHGWPTHVSQESIEHPWYFTLLVEAVPSPIQVLEGVDPTTQWEWGRKVFVASLFLIIFNNFICGTVQVFFF